MAGSLLLVVAVILIVGIGAHLLAQRLRIPSVLFFIAIGLVFGPNGIGLVTLDTFGAGLTPIVGLSVAIIVFDGAFDLRLERIRDASTTSLRLVTIGSVLMFVGTATAVHFLTGAPWEIALVVGALLIATGPTVITPILEVVQLREHVATALETEGIVNDVTAAIAAVVLFETLLLDDLGFHISVAAFAERMGVGIAAGILATVIIYGLLEYEITPSRAPRAARFLLLTAAIGSFSLAEVIAPEAGIAAAATAGVVLGNLELPHRETMEEFGRDATLIVLAFVFISLAALIDVGAIIDLGVSGVLLVGIVMVVLRPVIAGVATVGVDQFTVSERLFLAAVGPRGIIPASVATLFAIELATAGSEGAAQTLLGTVFIVILATVLIEAGLARQIGDFLGVTPMRTIIIGGGRVGLALAHRLENRGEFVVVVESDGEQLEQAREAGFTVHEGDGTETDVLRQAGIDEAKIVVAATNDDDVNLLVCQLARTKFDINDIYARVNEPDNIEAFGSLSVTAIDASMATAYAIDNEIERPALTHWMTDLGDGHDIQEIEVTATDIAGKSIRDLHEEIPGGCLVAEIGQGEEAHVPDPDETISTGDHVTFLGDSEAVASAIKRFHPHE